MRGLLKLAWLETKIFMREPMGAIGTILIPVLVFVGLGRFAGRSVSLETAAGSALMRTNLPVFAVIFITISAVLSLVTIISIYRDGGILKRLRATPLRPATILTAHVVVKLVLTVVSMSIMVAAGRRYYPAGVNVSVIPATVALVIATWSILSIGFIIASVVPTARFAQPIGAAIFYPMIALSGLFVPIAVMPGGVKLIARLMPLTYAVSLLRGVWQGERWSAHLGDVAALVVVFGVSVAISSRIFRWE
jgi:ABC-2 type transport system permease protein